MDKSRELLISVAKNYYIDSMPQAKIAALYHLSRPTISNILKECREKGIVEIRVNDTSPFFSPEGQQLQNTYGLNSVCVTPTETDYSLTLYKTCAQAAIYFVSLLVDNIRIGVSLGESLYHMIRQLPQTGVVNSEAVQLMGGMGAWAPLYDGSELARNLAEKLNGRFVTLLSPLVVQTEESKQFFITEPGIRDALKKSENLDIALVGVSPSLPESSALVRSGFLSPEEAHEIYDNGAYGHLSGYHFDSKGVFMDISFNRRVVGINTDVYLRIPRRIGIACGVHKNQAIKAALQGGLITDLFTDKTTALHILNQQE
jgi:DNA-binding transcriptional regulator LsrR (DeoR family)